MVQGFNVHIIIFVCLVIVNIITSWILNAAFLFFHAHNGGSTLSVLFLFESVHIEWHEIRR